MSYQALARQYRPQNFTELVGQEHVSQALINGLEQDRIHHAFLFTGTRGVGKTTVARILAKALNCETGVTGNPCGECTACREISEGRFVDLVEVDAASRTGVDDTRELLENVQYAPTSGRYKIYLIDEVHMFSNSSFNALLKTLEEPPPHVKFLLATTEPKKLPVTVLSRCLQFNLKRLSLSQIKDHLIKLLALQEAEFDNAAIDLIARAADGSMRDGLSLLDQSLAFGAGKVLEKDVKLMLGTMDQESVVHLLNHIVDKDAENLSSHLKQIFSMAPDYSRFLDEMALLLHEVSLLQILNNYVDGSQFDRATIKNLFDKTTPEQVQLYYQIVMKGQTEIQLAPDSKTGFEMTVIRMFAFKIGSPKPVVGDDNTQKTTPIKSRGNLKSASQNTDLNNSTTNSHATPAQSQPQPQPLIERTVVEQNQPFKKQQYSISEITVNNWDEVFSQLLLKGTARELARNAHIISNNNNVLLLAIDKQAHAFMTDNAQNKLINAIENIIKEQISVELTTDVNAAQTIARTEQHQRDDSIKQTHQKVEQNPFIQQMQKDFDAQVIQIKQGESFLEVKNER